MTAGRCAVDGCTIPGRLKRGFCSRHYQRWLRTGSPHRVTPLDDLRRLAVTETDECLPWPRSSAGRGNIVYAGRQWSPARLALRLATGIEGEVARHRCRTPSCVNVRHLAWGTQADNMRDKVRDGTAQAGERHPLAKLTWAEVRAIRASPAPTGELVALYGVSRSQVKRIRRGEGWREHPCSGLPDPS